MLREGAGVADGYTLYMGEGCDGMQYIQIKIR